MKYSFNFVSSFMTRSFLNDLNKHMPMFVGLKQNSAAEIISSKKLLENDDLNCQQDNNNNDNCVTNDQGQHCLRKVKLCKDKNR